jgi:MFS family permease
VLGGALCLDALDVSMVGVALPSIRSALGLSTSSLQWIVSGYVLGYGGLLTTTFPEGPVRNRAFSIYTVFGASGFSLGLVLSGALTEISWRWTLLVSAPVALGVLIAATAGRAVDDRTVRVQSL